jgi:hypothetical protein
LPQEIAWPGIDVGGLANQRRHSAECQEMIKTSG